MYVPEKMKYLADGGRMFNVQNNVFVCVCVCVCVRARASMRASVLGCVRARVYM
jgi:hypothetical protein